MKKRYNVVDIKGKKFGSLTAVRIDDNSISGHLKWICKCECGVTKSVKGSNLKGGLSKSCGNSCPYNSKNTHMKSGTTEYVSWCSMRARCYNSDTHGYERYGGRGIKVCDRWLGKDGFKNFLVDMGEKPSKEHQIDRIDTYGNYEPSNCRWATRAEQGANRRDSVYIEYQGVTKTKMQWAKQLNIRYGTLNERLRRGWTLERAFNERPEMHHLFRKTL